MSPLSSWPGPVALRTSLTEWITERIHTLSQPLVPLGSGPSPGGQTLADQGQAGFLPLGERGWPLLQAGLLRLWESGLFLLELVLLALLALLLVQALLRLLAALIPALNVLIDRARETASRLWRLGLGLLRELLWVDPARRRARHARWPRTGEEDPGLGHGLLLTLLDLVCLPIDWLASLGLQRLLRPDPATEEKERRRHHEPGGLTARLGWVWSRHVTIHLLLSGLRLLLPRLWLPAAAWRQLVRPDSYAPAFPIRGMIWLSLNADVREVLARPETFEVIYGPRMQNATRPVDLPVEPDLGNDPSERGNFLLGMQDTPRYWRDISNMRLAFRREDSERCRRLAEETAATALRRSIQAHQLQASAAVPMVLDLPEQLILPAVEALINQYFGLPVPLRCSVAEELDGGDDPAAAPTRALVDHGHAWLEAVFNHLFYDLKGEKSLKACSEAAPRVRRALMEIIERAHQGTDPGSDTVLSRCLRLQQAGTPGMDDETLRVNLTGFLVGAVTPLFNATCQVMDVLLDRPRALAQAQAAARRDDIAGVRACLMEALRFQPGDPVIYRWTRADTWIGAGSRRCSVPKGTLVMAWNASAMSDPAAVPAPWDFRSDRPAEAYLHWGHGQHSCAGAYINMAVIPGVLTPLLRQRRLRRAPGPGGQMRKDGKGGITVRHFELQVWPDTDAKS